MNRLLERQIRKLAGSLNAIPREYQVLFQAISDAYDAFDADRNLMERVFDLNSLEFAATNKSLQKEIEERRKAVEALVLAQDFSQALLESMETAVVACDADGKLVLFNRAARQWHGLDCIAIPQAEWSAYYNLYFDDGVTPMDTDSIPLLRAFRGEVVRDAGMVIAAKGRPKRQIIANGAPIRNKDGKIIGAVAVMHDITEHKRLEQEVAKRLHELEVFYKASMGREERILELKKKISELEEKLKIS